VEVVLGVSVLVEMTLESGTRTKKTMTPETLLHATCVRVLWNLHLLSRYLVHTAQRTVVHSKGSLEQIQRLIVQSASHDEGGRLALVCERDKVGAALTLWRCEGGQDFLRYETFARLQGH